MIRGNQQGKGNRETQRESRSQWFLQAFPRKLEFYPVDNGKSLKMFKEGSLFSYFKCLIADFIIAHVPFKGNDDSGKLVFCIYIFVNINNKVFEICYFACKR